MFDKVALIGENLQSLVVSLVWDSNRSVRGGYNTTDFWDRSLYNQQSWIRLATSNMPSGIDSIQLKREIPLSALYYFNVQLPNPRTNTNSQRSRRVHILYAPSGEIASALKVHPETSDLALNISRYISSNMSLLSEVMQISPMT